jgi:hypothetical protein
LSDKHLHIVSFDIPYPADYGGVIDVYFKLIALFNEGVKVHLHCFEYGRSPAPVLEEYCEEVHYYHRSTSKALLLHGLPYVVVSRRSEEMVERLMADDHPILFEGLHSCYHLGDNRLVGRKRLVRTHNVEHQYYGALAEAEENAFKRTYFQREAAKLEKYEPVLSEADELLCISMNDLAYFKHYVGKGVLVPAFHSNTTVRIPTGIGNGVLYHGNLAVAENDRAARFLVDEVLAGSTIPLTVAGSNPSSRLKKSVSERPNTFLVTDVGPDQIRDLVMQAQVNVLPTFQATGIKLKLLQCLFAGRHIVCNTPMVQDTGLEGLCHVHDNPKEILAAIEHRMDKPVTEEESAARSKALDGSFSNAHGAQIIKELL